MTLPLPDIGQVREAICLDILVRWLASDHQVATQAARHPRLAEAPLSEAPLSEAHLSEAQLSGVQVPRGAVPPSSRSSPARLPAFDAASVTARPGHGLDVGPVRPAVPVTHALDRARPQEVRYFLAQAHYRQSVAYSDAALEAAALAYQRIEQFVARASRDLPPLPALSADALPLSFIDAMDDDLSVPAALASVHATVHDGNYAVARATGILVATSLAHARSMLGILGLDPLDPYLARWEFNR